MAFFITSEDFISKMILYCYKCNDCNHTWEEWRTGDNLAGPCMVCKSSNTSRNYKAENKVLVPDIEPGFNQSLGIEYTGRRDLLTKMKSAGFGSMQHGGGIHTTTGINKSLYGEEEYREKVLKVGANGGFDNWYNEQLEKGIEQSTVQDDGAGYPDGALERGQTRPETMRKRRVKGHDVFERLS